MKAHGLTSDLSTGKLVSNADPKRTTRENDAPSGDTRSANPSHAAIQARTRSGNSSHHTGLVPELVCGRPRLPLSRFATPGDARVDRGRVGRFGQQSKSSLLPTDENGP